MAELIRRILWLIPVLIAGAFVAFFVFGTTPQVERRLSRPLFYNPAPESAEIAAKEALNLARRGDVRGQAQLGILGGAALPIILRELSTLPVPEQRAIAEGLKPVAERMQLASEGGFASPHFGERDEQLAADRALLFWERYRDEHALDLRPLAASRLVKRAAQREGQLQNADLLAIDTYALPHLVSSVGRITRAEDVTRGRRLARAITHATGTPFVIREGASVEEARRVATEIRNYWDEYGAQWTELGRTELLVARFSQTEFAAWVFRALRQSTGFDSPVMWEKLSVRGRVSISLAALCLLGLLVIGPSIAAVIQVLSLRRSRWQLERWGLRAALALGLMTLAPLLVAPGRADAFRLSLLSVLTGTIFSAFILQRELQDRMDWRTHHVLRGRPGFEKVGAIVRWLAPSVPTLTPIAVAEAALWVTCLEASSGTDGLGAGALRAYIEGDLDFLVTLCLGLGLATGIAQILADLLLRVERSPQGEM